MVNMQNRRIFLNKISEVLRPQLRPQMNFYAKNNKKHQRTFLATTSEGFGRFLTTNYEAMEVILRPKSFFL